MGTNDDFFISFGSNAKSFSNQLIAELAPAKAEVQLIGRMLSSLNAQGAKGAELRAKLAGELGAGGGGGGAVAPPDMSAWEDASKEMATDLRKMMGSLTAITTALNGMVPGTEKAVQHYNRSQGAKGRLDKNWRDANGNFATAGTPGARPAVGGLAAMATAARPSISTAPAPATTGFQRVSVAALTKVQLEAASLDRVVKAVNEVRDEVRKIATRPVPAGAQAAPAAAPAAPASSATPKTSSSIEDSAARIEKMEAQTRRDIAEIEVDMQKLSAILAQSGGALDDGMQDALSALTATHSKLKADLNAIERERTGVSRTAQSAARKEQHKLAPDLPSEEFDRRTKMRQRLNLALEPDAFRANVGTGKGQLRREDVVAMAKQLTTLGFNTPATTRMNVPDIVENVLSSRQAMLGHYGADVPSELQTGRRIVSDKVSDNVRDIIERANITPEDADRDRADRESIRAAYLAGHLPKEPTQELTYDPLGKSKLLHPNDLPSLGFGMSDELANAVKAMGQMPGLSGRDLSEMWTSAGSAVRVPRGMVKGGDYNDVYGLNPAIEGLRQRSLGRAANLAMQPGWDPFKVKLHEEVTGQGDEAMDARRVFRALRQATRELDDLGNEFEVFGDALNENEKFIERARQRMARVATGQGSEEDRKKAATDPAKLAAAEDNAERLRAEMMSGRFQGLQDVFEDPTYQEGRRERAISRRDMDARMEAQAARDRETFIGDAAGYGMINSRLAPGTKSAIISDLPGARYDARKNAFAFKDDGRDPAELEQLNQAWRRTQAGLNKERQFGPEVDEGTRPVEDLNKQRRRTENAATNFLSQVEKVFGIPMTIDRVLDQTRGGYRTDQDALGYDAALGYGPAVKRYTEESGGPREFLNEENAEKDRARRDRAAAMREETLRKTKRQSPEQILALRDKAVKQTTAELAAAVKKEEEASTALAASKKGLTSATDRLSAAERKEYDAAVAQAATARAQERRAGKQIIELGEASSNRAKFRNAETDLPKRVFSVGGGGEAEVLPILKHLERQEGEASRVAKEAEARAKAILGVDDDTAKSASAQEGEARFRQAEVERLRETLKRQQTAAAEAREELRGLSSQVPDNKPGAGTQADRTAAKVQNAELREMATNIDQATKARAEYNKVRGQIKAGRAAGEDVSGLTAQRDAIKGSDAFMGATQLRAMRKDYHAKMAEVVAAGAGAGAGDGAPPAPPKGPRGSGGVGDDSSSNAILRDILSALNGIHRTLQTGVRTTGPGAARAQVDAQGNPVKRKSPTSFLYPTKTELDNANSGDAERQALAAAAQQRRIEKLRERDNPLDLAGPQGQAIKDHNKFLREEEQQTRRNANMTTAQAHEKLQLAAAHKTLDQVARQELATLKKLNAEGAHASDIARQQAKAVAAVERSMLNGGVGGTDRRRLGQTLLNDTQTPNQPKLDTGTYDQLRRSARSIDGFRTVDRSMASGVAPGGIFGEQSEFTQAMFGNHGFWSRVMNSTGTFIVRNFTAGFVFGLTAALQDIIYQGIITESTFIRVSDALEQTGRSAGNLRTQLQGISSQYGVALNDVYMTAAGLTGMFDSIDDISAATEVVAQLQAISMGALNAQEAMGVLASITGAYGDDLKGGVDGLTQVADVLTVIQNTLGTNVEVTSEGVGRLSGLSNQLKLDFQDTAVYVGQIAKLTNQTGAAAGEQFSRILASMQSGRGRAALAEALPDSGIDSLIGQGEYGEALKVLLRDWDGLSEAQQRNLTVTIAGQRQAAAFAALMNNSSKVLNASAEAHHANGQAAQRAEKIANTLNGQIQRLMTNLQNLAQNLVRTGLLDFFGLLLKVLNGTLTGINKVFSVMNDIFDSNPLLSALKHMTAGLLGFILTLALATKAFHGFKASMAAMRAGDGMMAMGMNAMSGGAGPAAPGVRATLAGAPGALATRLETTSRRADLRAKPQRIFSVDSAGSTAVQDAARVNKAQVAAHTAVSKSAAASAKALRGLSVGISAVGGAGLGAQVGIMLFIAALGVGINELKKSADRQEEFRKLVEETYGSKGEEKEDRTQDDRYIGPFTAARDATLKDTEGPWNQIQYANITRPLDLALHPVEGAKDAWDVFKGSGYNPMSVLGPGTFANNSKAYNEWRGVLPEEEAARLDEMRKYVDDRLLEGGSDRMKERPYELMGKLLGPAMERADEKRKGKPASEKQVMAMAEDFNKKANAARMEVLNDTGLSEEQKNAALAELEEIAVLSNERIAAMLLRARGIADADNLSMQQISMIDRARQSLGQVAMSGDMTALEQFGDGIDAIIKETGVRKGSTIGKSLNRLAEGNMTQAEVMREEQIQLGVELENIQAKYLSATSGETTLEPEQLEELEGEFLSKISQMAALTDSILQAFVDESVTLATAAANAGNYDVAETELQKGLARLATTRDRDSEDPVTRARRDAMEAQTYSQSAGYAAQEKNTRLQVASARSQSSETDARLEARIAQNTYRALMNAQKQARELGQQGPPMEQLRSAKMAWIQAEHQVSNLAQQANIAAMAAAVAGTWNGIAAAQGQEMIALQQYRDAKANFGAGSIEALGALAAYRNSQKSTVSTMDQVAAATRDAAMAAIPQGDAVAVANAGVANARAALAAAEKYGTNSSEYQGALAALYSAQQAAMAAQMSVTQAQAALAQAYAEARGDGVAAARAGVAVARAAMQAALAASGGVRSAEVIGAQAGLVAANAAVSQAQEELITSRVGVTIALADAAGDTVEAAILQLRQARIALAFARRRSGGEMTAEVNAARAAAISAQAAVRDARLQDDLDTIDFNLEMGRMTQSSAISALREILRTRDLTKQQRRDLMLQIKGMQEELSGSPWNFGDIKLPTPYSMRRFIAQQRDANTRRADAAIEASLGVRAGAGAGMGPSGGSSYVDSSTTTIMINGADTAKVRRVVEEVVSKAGKTMTTQSRRGR